MPSDELDVVFQLGAEIQEDFLAAVSELADAVDLTQDRIEGSFESIASNAIANSQRMMAESSRSHQKAVGGPDGPDSPIVGPASMALSVHVDTSQIDEQIAEIRASAAEPVSMAVSVETNDTVQNTEAVTAAVSEMRKEYQLSAEDQAYLAERQAKQQEVVAQSNKEWSEKIRRAAAKERGEVQVNHDMEEAFAKADKRIAEEKRKAKEEAAAEASRQTKQRIDELAAESKAAIDAAGAEIKARIRASGQTKRGAQSLRELETRHVHLKARVEEYNKRQAIAGTVVQDFANQGVVAFGQIARAAALFGFAQSENEEQNEKTLKTLAQIQGAVDATVGSYRAFEAVSGVVDGVRAVLAAKRAATFADMRATVISNRISKLRKAELGAETAATNSLAAATGRLSTARRADAAAAGLQGAGGAAGGAGRGFARGAGSRVAGSVGGGVVGGGVGAAFAGTIKAAGAAIFSVSGVVVAAALAAAGGLLFARKSAVEAGKDFLLFGYRGGGEVGGWSDRVGAAVASFEDGIGDLVGTDLRIFGDIINDEETELAEQRAKEFKARQAALDAVEAIEIRAASEAAGRARERDEKLFSIELMKAEGDTEKLLSLERQREQKLLDQLSAAEARAESLRSADGEFRIGDSEAEKARARAVLNELIALEQDHENQIGRVAQAERAAADARRSQTIETLSGIQSIIAARSAEIEQLEGAIQTAAEQFDSLGSFGQEEFKDAFKRGLKDPTKLTRDDIDILSKVRTRQTNKIVADARRRFADEAGFSQIQLDEFDLKSQAERDVAALDREFRDRVGPDIKLPDQKLGIHDFRKIDIELQELDQKLLNESLSEMAKKINARSDILADQLRQAFTEIEKLKVGSTEDRSVRNALEASSPIVY